jgi:hypothetical protein
MKLERRTKLQRARLCIAIKRGDTELNPTSLTDTQLAKLVDISPSYLSKVKRANAAVRDLVIQIAAE